jgi:hypothetical protein
MGWKSHWKKNGNASLVFSTQFSATLSGDDVDLHFEAPAFKYVDSYFLALHCTDRCH